MSVKTNQKTEQKRELTNRPEPAANLDHRYGQIGIPAVAAALRYWTAAIKPVRQSGPVRIDERFIELAA